MDKKVRFSRRDFMRLAGLGTAAALLGGCQPLPEVTPAPGEEVEQETTAAPAPAELTGTVSFSIYGDPVVFEELGEEATGGWGECYLLIKQWQEMHPNVEIEWAPITMEGGAARAGAIRTMLLAGTLPDIVSDYPVREVFEGNLDLVYDLTPDLEQPNPYGSTERWEDEFPIGTKYFAQNQPWIPDDKRYFVGNTFTGDMGTVAFFYNKDMFEEAGITEIPATWSEFIEDCQKLKDAGFAAYVGDNIPWGARSWMIRWWPEQLIDAELSHVAEKFGLNELTLEAIDWAVMNGVIDPRSKCYLETPRLIKEFSQYWNEDWNAPEEVDYWLTKRAAMMQSGNWSLATLSKSEERDFEFGTFYYPSFDEATTECATGVPWHRLGGFEGGTSGNSMFVPLTTVENGNWPLARDLLHYITARPSNDWYCSRQYPPCIPVDQAWDEVITDPVDRDRLYGFFNPPMSQDTFLRNLGNSGMLDIEMRLLDEYMLDEITLEQYGERLYEEWMRKIERDIVEHPEWNVDEWPEP